LAISSSYQLSLPSLFMLHPAGGGILQYKKLADLICQACGQSVYGIEDNRDGKWGSLQEMVKEYANAVERLYPNGTVAVLGYSLGGIVCYELAQLLMMRGRKVIYIALLDADMSDNKSNYQDHRLLWILANYISRWDEEVLLGLSESQPPEVLCKELLTRLEKYGMGAEDIHSFVSLFYTHIDLVSNYSPQPLKVPETKLIFFSAKPSHDVWAHDWFRSSTATNTYLKTFATEHIYLLKDAEKEIATSLSSFLNKD